MASEERQTYHYGLVKIHNGQVIATVKGDSHIGRHITVFKAEHKLKDIPWYPIHDDGEGGHVCAAIVGKDVIILTKKDRFP